MNLKLVNPFLIILIALVALTGCDRARDMVADTTLPADTPMDDTGIDMAMEAPVKLVWLVDFPEGGRDAYTAWVASISETLQAPEELTQIRGYANVDLEMRPNLYIEFEFKSFLDAATYHNRPEIVAILEDQPNYLTDASVHTFIQRSYYTTDADVDWKAKGILLIDYPLGGRQAYLDWAASVSSTIVEPPELKAVAVYENYYGVSPQRLVTFEFANQADADTYEQLEVIMALEAELDTYSPSWVEHRFELISE